MAIHDTLARLRAVDRPALVVEPDPASPPRVAILPGSFDPITVAHAALADAAREWADVVVLVYSVRTIAKEAEPPWLTEEQRIRQLGAFVAATEGLAVGLGSHGLLVDQIDAARRRFPAAELRLVIGSDKVIQLLDPAWYEDRDRALDRLFAEADVRYAVRAGEEQPLRRALAANPRWRDRFVRMDVPPDVAAVSSREARSLLRRGQDVTHLVPEAALDAVRAAGVLPGEDGKEFTRRKP